MEMVGATRAGAGELTFEQVAHLLTGQVRSDLDRLLQFDAGLGMARLAWLIKPAVEATASAVKTSIEKLEFLRAMDAHLLDLSMLLFEQADEFAWPIHLGDWCRRWLAKLPRLSRRGPPGCAARRRSAGRPGRRVCSCPTGPLLRQ